MLGLLIVHDGTNNDGALRRRETLLCRLVNITIYFDGRWKAGRDEQVGTILGNHLLEQRLHHSCCLIAFHRASPCPKCRFVDQSFAIAR